MQQTSLDDPGILGGTEGILGSPTEENWLTKAGEGILGALPKDIPEYIAPKAPKVSDSPKVDMNKLQEQLKQNLSRGYSDSQVLDNLQQSPSLEMNQQIRNARSQFGDAGAMKLFLGYVQKKTGTDFGQPTVASAFENLVKNAPGMGAYDTVKELTNAALTGTVGSAAANIKSGGNEQKLREPIDLPGVGNINPWSKTPMQLGGQGVNLAVTALNPFNRAANVLSGMIGKHAVINGLIRYGASGLTGSALSGSAAAAQNRPFDEVKAAAGFGLALGIALPVGQDIWANRKGVYSAFWSGVSKLTGDDTKVPLKKVDEMVNNHQKILETTESTKDAIQLAQDYHEKQYGEALQKNFGSEAASKIVPVRGSRGIQTSFEQLLNDKYKIKLLTDLKTGDRYLDFSNSVIGGDKVAQGQVAAYWSTLNELPNSITVSQLDTIKQQIGHGINWSNVQSLAKATTFQDAIGSTLWGDMRGRIVEAIPGMDKVYGDWASWMTTMKTVGNGVNSLANGDAFLRNAFNKPNYAILDSLQKIETAAQAQAASQGLPAVNIIEDIRAANIANMIIKGKGSFGSTFSILLGATLGTLGGGLTPGAGISGALAGTVMAPILGPAANRFAIREALKTTQAAQAAITPLFQNSNPIVQKTLQNAVTSLNPSKPRNSGWEEFWSGMSKAHPGVDEQTAYQMYQQALKQVQSYATPSQ